MIDRALRHCRTVFDVALPVRCAACGMHGDEFCLRCLRDLRHSSLLRRPARGEVPCVMALGPHRGSLRAAILNLKFRNRTHAGEILGALLGEKLDCRDEVIVPVPLHPRRLIERGFNQAAVIAEGIARSSGALMSAHVLDRTRQAHTQRALPLARRWSNVSDAYAVAEAGAALRGGRVMLVDDVVTTGATIAACARVLRHAGVVRVRAAAIAIKI